MALTPFKKYQRQNSIVFRQVHPIYRRTVYTSHVHPAYGPWLKVIFHPAQRTRKVEKRNGTIRLSNTFATYQGRDVEVTKKHRDGSCVIAWHDRWQGWLRTTVPSMCLNSACQDEIAALRREVGNPSELDRVMEGSRPLRDRYEDGLEVIRRQAVQIEELERKIEALKSGRR